MIIPIVCSMTMAFIMGWHFGFQACEKCEKEGKDFVDELERKGLLPRG